MKQVIKNVLAYAIVYTVLLTGKEHLGFETAVLFGLAHLMSTQILKEIEK
jgi:hypothetical protein